MRPSVSRSALLLLAFLLAHPVAEARGKKKKETPTDDRPTIVAGEWLRRGPTTMPAAAFADGDGAKALLDAATLPSPHAAPGERWERASATATLPEGDGLAVVWGIAWLKLDRHAKLEIEVTGSHPRRVWVDGTPLASGGTGAADEEVRGETGLDPGTHAVLVKSVRDPSRDADWRPGLTVRGDAGSLAGATLAASPERGVEFRDVTDAPSVDSIALSPDGRRYVRGVSRIRPGTHDREAWIEMRSVEPDALMTTWRGASGMRSVAWSPDGRYVSWLAATPGDDAGTTLMLHDLESGDVRPLLEGVERLRSYAWSPAGDGIVLTIGVEAKKNETGVKRLRGLMDRWPTWRDRNYLHRVEVPSGVTRRLTAGDETTALQDISRDGERILFSRQIEDLDAIPFSRTELWEMRLDDGEATRLHTFGWFNFAAYAPVGGKLLIGARAAEFDGAGENLREGQIGNPYDGQLFLWDPATGEVDAITREFDPAVEGATWSRRDGRIYLRATDRDRVEVYRYDPADRSFVELEVGIDDVDGMTLAEGAPRALVTGTSAWVPQRLYAVDTEGGEPSRLSHPNEAWFADVTFGTVEPWSFETADGKTIDGRVYFPPDFDPEKTYPTIVYYYGGTVPVTRSFGGRYPKEWWASLGYLVYVPQPSGATGYGQAFSAEHVNNWGKTTADQIVEGTRKYLAAHPFADPARVGCIGASYGGFMTMLLSTRTDVFAGAVAHAGISSISSYWGEGYWGYLYSSAATAGSYPWNRPDIYVDQSPLFRADEHRVPLLLTHGSSDTNVPVGESDQFFIALRLLGKQVEYLQIAGEDHWILDHAKRTLWSRSLVAWFDRWLKGDAGWWDALYPASDDGDDDGDDDDDDGGAAG